MKYLPRILTPLLFLLLSVPLFAQQKPAENVPSYHEKMNVNLVLVDATVTDRTGQQILGLGKDDFIVKENGVPQKIQSVDYYTDRRLLTSPESQAAFKVEHVKEGRWFVIFFDKLVDTSQLPNYMSDLMNAKQAAARFVQHDLLPQDKVAIAGFDVRLKIYSDFTSDQKQLEQALNEAVTGADGLTRVPKNAADLSIMRNIDVNDMMHAGRIYDAIETLSKALQPIQARKAMMLFTLGIGDVSTFSRDIPANEEIWYKPMVHALNKSNVTVYPIQLLRNSQFHATEQTLSRLADDTGGEYFRQIVNFITPLKRIENLNNGYYMITYRSEKPENEHGYQKIQVSLKNPEFNVSAREGYPY
ncbi:MAG: VWA domain-containing protein [Thermoanaerobaculia bacterium]